MVFRLEEGEVDGPSLTGLCRMSLSCPASLWGPRAQTWGNRDFGGLLLLCPGVGMVWEAGGFEGLH